MSHLDERLSRGLRDAARPAAPDLGALTDEVTRRRARRSRVRRAQAVTVVVLVLGGLVTGVVALDRTRETPLVGTPETPAPGPTPSLQLTPTPSASATPGTQGRDIGLGVNICSDVRLGGLDLLPGGERDTAWTGYPVLEDGRCPRNSVNQEWLVAVDVTGDGRPDASADLPLVNCPYVGCSPLGATDLDADGDGELVVMTQFSILDHMYFSVDETGSETYVVRPILVADPGHPSAGVLPGEPLVTSSAGDAGYAAWIRCEGYPDAPILVFTYVDSVVESGQPSEWHEVKLELRDDGRFHVVDATDLTLPPGQDPGLERSEAPACGVDFNPWAPPNP